MKQYISKIQVWGSGIALSVVGLILPQVATAQGTGILPACAATDGGCGVCDMLALMGNIATLILDLASAVTILAFIAGGMFWMLSFGNAERVDRGKQIITGAVIGLVVVFFAFTFMNILLMTLVGQEDADIVRPFENATNYSGAKAWNQICVDAESKATATDQIEYGCRSTNIEGRCILEDVPECSSYADGCKCQEGAAPASQPWAKTYVVEGKNYYCGDPVNQVEEISFCELAENDGKDCTYDDCTPLSPYGACKCTSNRCAIVLCADSANIGSSCVTAHCSGPDCKCQSNGTCAE